MTHWCKFFSLLTWQTNSDDLSDAQIEKQKKDIMGRIFYTVASLDSSLETMFKRVDEVVRQESGQRQKERQVLLEEESKERERKGKRMSNNNFGELTEPEIAEIAEMAEPVVSASAIDVAPEATCTTAVVEEKEEKKQQEEEEEEEEKIVVVLPPPPPPPLLLARVTPEDFVEDLSEEQVLFFLNKLR